VSMFITGMQYGDKVAVHVSRGAVLCIAGDSLAIGYINRPELMADKWQTNPFGKGKLYHSGDLARYTSDGQIEFLGRIDKQVKVNGYRIALDEIENAILAIRGISDCVVTVSHFDTSSAERRVGHEC
ncbi:AMP-binding protein, partial [Staphylococcus aureus]|uniref:AMP-binding protein n=1 Tax=Staphylococcus aureus TaxID=1280 RepID=UPI00210AA9E2